MNAVRRMNFAAFFGSAFLLACLPASDSAAAAPAFKEQAFKEKAGTLPSGHPYIIRMPENWNGVVLNDLDRVPNVNGPRDTYFASRGFALTGLGRHPLRRQQYDPAQEVSDLITVLDMFEKEHGRPKRVIQYGTSGGGHVALAMAELHPERIHGSVALCAHTPIFAAGTRFDVLFALKALLGPNDDKLAFVNLPNDDKAYIAHWRVVLGEAQKTPQGRARTALAFMIAPWSAWTKDGTSRPDESDMEGMVRAITDTATELSDIITAQYHFNLQGVLSGNEGVDYAARYGELNVNQRRLVDSLYTSADLSVQDDLKRINSAPRVAADKKAVAYWLGNPARTVRGLPQIPVLRIHTIGDNLVIAAQTGVYGDLVRTNKKEGLYRTAFVERGRHCNFSVAEHAAALEVMMSRLDSGSWGEVGPDRLNARAAAAAVSGAGVGREGAPSVSPAAGSSAFTAYEPPSYSGAWRLRQTH